MLVRQADLGKPFNREDIRDAVYALCLEMSSERQDKLPFKDLVPGPDFVTAFLERHHDVIRLGRPAREAEIRWRAINGEVLTTHVAVMEWIRDE